MKIPRQVVFEVARGFRGRSKGCIKLASTRAARALLYSFNARRKRHTYIRIHWTATVNRAAREWNLNYSRFVGALGSLNCWLNRKSLFILSLNEPVTFKALVDESKYALNEPRRKPRNISDL
ncbi:ribosomal protein L20, putative [Babesia bigemina]|uniref:Ribosomal protein L20, putative n=1 Tax=Babesia bigemina TaxID=5866 RepID=A0A061DEB0_BABBI|nr:ribosomal protein L20, putative [Babesia bigemina]CDR96990.1 ribosomal protein L20, putative [Babesia bigemina]|eukprot:XP_012769176.1 ribosomal protein L20, putative [Babesia bigemina]